MSTGLAAAQGEHLARSPVPATVPPALEVTDEKPLHWVGSSKRDFLSFPASAKEDMGNALGIAQFGGTAPTAKPWKGLGLVYWRSSSRTMATRIERCTRFGS